ncbi:class I SAM-dependent methyltransferase [Ilyomonas limi]|uniref:Class I SAM-dependent methyltransferase n=1 Tax=Ilyomonas limi TaxID=2575867 RepID=A0A4U3KUR0_9BACT|nr:class I SAM-dependent methyltransferase [Ilyomonas limi]TKK66285.1 class I SAM-dependent methyltransferase [Ilyomonas limi]
MKTSSYIPALRYHWLTGFYDFLLGITFPEKKIKQALIEQLNLTGNETILDFGCGTATLSIMIKKNFPSVRIIAIDVDDKVLSLAEEKIKQAGEIIELKKYDGEDLPFNACHCFDKIVSSLVFHHISTMRKRIILGQLPKLLKPKGEFHIADFGKASSLYTKLAFAIFRRFDGEENTRVNALGLLPEFIKEGGFQEVKITQSFGTAYGTVYLIKSFNI